MSIWQWLRRLLGLGGSSRPGDLRANPAPDVTRLLAEEDGERRKLIEAEAERARLRQKDELLQRALDRKTQEAKDVKDTQVLKRIASDLVHLRREREGVSQQVSHWESLRTQIQTMLLAMEQLRILMKQRTSSEQIAQLTTQLDQLLSLRRETEAALDVLRGAAAQPVSQDMEVARELQRLQDEASDVSTADSATATEEPESTPGTPPQTDCDEDEPMPA